MVTSLKRSENKGQIHNLQSNIYNLLKNSEAIIKNIGPYKKHLKNVGPIRHCEPPHAACFNIAIHQVSLLSHAACATTTSTTTTTRDRGDRYGPIEWAQRGKTYSPPRTHAGRAKLLHVQRA